MIFLVAWSGLTIVVLLLLVLRAQVIVYNNFVFGCRNNNSSDVMKSILIVSRTRFIKLYKILTTLPHYRWWSLMPILSAWDFTAGKIFYYNPRCLVIPLLWWKWSWNHILLGWWCISSQFLLITSDGVTKGTVLDLIWLSIFVIDNTLTKKVIMLLSEASSCCTCCSRLIPSGHSLNWGRTPLLLNWVQNRELNIF